MSSKLNRPAYRQMIEEDLQWLLAQPRTLERDHIEAIVRASEEHEYGPPRSGTMSENQEQARLAIVLCIIIYGPMLLLAAFEGCR